jgi:RHS repeat-associated protein
MDQNANVVARHDYLPFGAEIPSGWAGRSSLWGAGDGVDLKFTGQERDSETGLDFFQARYYGSALGRFTSPDPMNAGADPTNPQSWNGYAYVRQ